jgi:asparagine synthase (glutamine-hydrolysing)
MSAIFGVLRFGGGEVAESELGRMSNVLAHRGPDGRRFVVDGGVGLGHCLLRVNQEDIFEAQPVRDAEAGLTLVADCRIDNREELADQLGIDAATLSDMPDSALVLRAYKAWGEAAPERLLGDFTFAVWDERAKKLVLTRDHMGQRYVYYHLAKDFFVFSTEIKGLWAVEGVPREVREGTIVSRLMPETVTVGSGFSLYESIKGVLGATVLTVDVDGRLATRRYWEPHADPQHQGRDEAYYLRTYRALFEEAVACRLRRLTRPPALMLSAGFDSAAIAGLAGPTVTAQGRKLVTVSTVVSELHRGSVYDIRRWVEACQRTMPHLDVRYVIADKGSPLDQLEERFVRNDGMSAVVDHRTHAMFAQAAGAGARLLMDGVGGDFTLNSRGYGALSYLLRTGKLRRLFSELGPTMRATGQSLPQVIKRDVLTNLIPRRLLTRLYNGSWWRPDEFPLADDLLDRLLREGALRKERPLTRFPISAMQAISLYFATEHSLQSRPGKATPASSFGLELTRPLIDKRVVEFGLAIPEDLYVKNGRNRYLARTALADVYPPEFQTRIGPNDPSTPDMWSRIERANGDLLAEAQRLSSNPRITPYIDLQKVRRMLCAPGPQMAPATMRRRRFALYALMLARHIEWLETSNRG